MNILMSLFSRRINTMRKLVIQEAMKLKELLTDEEKERLNKESFNGDSPLLCIYGQSTGSCNSVRALELVRQCCTKVYDVRESRKNMDAAKSPLNGSPMGFTVDANDRVYNYMSPIEVYILSPNGGDKEGYKIIDFLKGYTNTLKLSL